MNSRRAVSRTGASIARRVTVDTRAQFTNGSLFCASPGCRRLHARNIGQLFLTAHVGCLLRKSLVHWIAISFGKHATRSSTRGLLLRDRLRNRHVSDVGGMSPIMTARTIDKSNSLTREILSKVENDNVNTILDVEKKQECRLPQVIVCRPL